MSSRLSRGFDIWALWMIWWHWTAVDWCFRAMILRLQRASDSMGLSPQRGGAAIDHGQVPLQFVIVFDVLETRLWRRGALMVVWEQYAKTLRFRKVFESK